MASNIVRDMSSDDEDETKNPPSTSQSAALRPKEAAGEDSDDNSDPGEKDNNADPDGTLTVVRTLPKAGSKPADVKFVWTIGQWTELRLQRQAQDYDESNYFSCESPRIENAAAGLRGYGGWKFKITGDAHEHDSESDSDDEKIPCGECGHEISEDEDEDANHDDLAVWYSYTGNLRRLHMSSLSVAIRTRSPTGKLELIVDTVDTEEGSGWQKIGDEIRASSFPAAFWTAKELIVEITPTVIDLKSTCQLDVDKQFGSFLRESYESTSFTDAVLVASDGKEIKVHRFVLCKHSEVFRAMFTHETTEKKTGVCRITDVSYESLKAFVEVLYGIAIVEDLANICEELYVVANKYQVAEVERRSLEMVEDSLSVGNAVERFVFAKENELGELEETVAGFVKENYTAFAAGGGPAEILRNAAEYPDGFFARLQKKNKKDKKKRKAQEAGLEERE